MMKRILGFIVLGLGISGCGEVLTEGEQETCDHGPQTYEVVEQALIDCTEKSDTGYKQGNPYPITVITYDGKLVETNTANAFWVMQRAAAEDGVNITIVSGFRTQAQQQYLYNCYINKNCNNGNLAARPGYSNHQSGLALDLNASSAGVYTWLSNNAGRFGFRRTVPSENWHWEWKGGVPDDGICGIEFNGCDTKIPPEGGVIDDAECFKPYGDPQYWRTESTGVGGKLHWTNAFKSSAPSNWARWFINVEEAGRYTVAFSRTDTWFAYDSTRYEVRANGAQETVTIDQSAGSEEWQVIGDFEFAAGQDQWVSVYDNSAIDVPADQHIGADAIRLTKYVPPVTPDPVPDPELEPGLEPGVNPIENPDQPVVDDLDPSTSADLDGEKDFAPSGPDGVSITARSGGCSAVGSVPSLWGLLMLVGFRMRRKRRTSRV